MIINLKSNNKEFIQVIKKQFELDSSELNEISNKHELNLDIENISSVIWNIMIGIGGLKGTFDVIDYIKEIYLKQVKKATPTKVEIEIDNVKVTIEDTMSLDEIDNTINNLKNKLD